MAGDPGLGYTLLEDGSRVILEDDSGFLLNDTADVTVAAAVVSGTISIPAPTVSDGQGYVHG